MELIVASYVADLIFGDPEYFCHPVRLIGRIVSFFETILNFEAHKNIQRLCGTIVSLSVISLSGLAAYVIIGLATKIDVIIGKIAWVFIAYTTLATKDLIVHARCVWKSLELGDIGKARQKLSLMVGRDTQDFSEEKIISATIETIAESTTDGIIAPLFYLFLGGPVLALSFKAISTLDSMIGHKDERYLYFGWFAAKLDDIANYIPARITGILICLAALLCAKDAKGAFRIMARDGRKQDSCNSAISEAAMAGALGVRLGGICSYSGRIVEHPYLGEEKKQVSRQLIKEAMLISFVTSLLMVIAGIAVQKLALFYL